MRSLCYWSIFSGYQITSHKWLFLLSCGGKKNTQVITCQMKERSDPAAPANHKITETGTNAKSTYTHCPPTPPQKILIIPSLFLIKGVRRTITQLLWKWLAAGKPTCCHGNSRVSGLKRGESERSLMNTALCSQPACVYWRLSTCAGSTCFPANVCCDAKSEQGRLLIPPH